MKMKTMVRKTVLYGIIGLSSLIMLLPFFWMLSASLKPETAVFQFPIQWIPEKPLWSNYVNIWEKIPLARYYLNTVKIAFCVTFLQLFTCSLAAYAFAKINFPERDKLFLVYLGTMMVPFQVVMIPQFILLKQFHLTNTHTGLILLQAFSPFGGVYAQTVLPQYSHGAFGGGPDRRAQRIWDIQPGDTSALQACAGVACHFYGFRFLERFPGTADFSQRQRQKDASDRHPEFYGGERHRLRFDHGGLGVRAAPGCDRVHFTSKIFCGRSCVIRAERMMAGDHL